MARKKIPADIETSILVKCRRRCCICYGLNRDNRVKQGQIAHLDHNRENNSEDNLSFLCLDHHDQYDSKTSQSKKITRFEVKRFRDELHQHIQDLWSKPLQFDEISVDIFSGHFERSGEFESSTLEIRFIGNNLIQVKGFALWGKTREFGPNIGELDFVAEIKGNRAMFVDKLFDEEYSLQLEFQGERLVAKENYITGYFGMNANFGGLYLKSE
jgi:hypothetical protein